MWEDTRVNPDLNLYAQHVSQSGVVDPTWPSGGRAISTAAHAQIEPAMISDGAGGAFIAWDDQRTLDQDIYAHHLLASGAVDPGWPANGLQLCADPGNQYYPQLARSGSDGVIVAWGDPKAKAQRVLTSGSIDPRWPANGRALSTAPGIQYSPSVCSDHFGGAIVAWQDSRSGGADWDVYAQCVTAASSLGIDFAQAAGFTGVFRASCAWADIDSDDGLDLLVAGTDFVGSRTDAYRYNGDTFSEMITGLPGVEWSALAPADYDGDGDIDLALCGWSNGTLLSGIWRNSFGLFADIGAGFPGVIAGTVAWADVDNDGDLDLLLAGQRIDASLIARLYRNDGGGLFVDAAAGLTGVYHCDAAWADFDGDGDQDLVLAGHDGTGGLTRLYRNDDGTLVNSGVALEGVWEGDVEWADYDNDGDLDLVVVGWDGSSRLARLYLNESSTLNDAGPLMPGLSSSAAAWADMDNDGDQDLVAAGFPDGGGGLSTFARNDTAGPAEPAMTLPGVYYSATAWGDYDHDGNIDLAIAGITSGSSLLTEIQRSYGTTPNTPPSAPGVSNAVRNGNDVTFSWAPASDDHTPVSALTYNLRVGTTVDGGDVMPGMAAGSGRRRVAQLGNVGQRLSWTLTLPPAIYYIGVQAVDGTFLGSEFVTHSTTGVTPEPVSVAGLRVPSPNPFVTRTEIAFTLSRPGPVDLAVYDAAGRRVRSLAKGEWPAGVGRVSWDGRDGDGTRMANGLYWIRLEGEGRRQTQKVVVMK